MRRDTQELLDGLGVSGLSADDQVRTLSIAEQQVVEIAKAVSHDARIISMDEPTAALADHEVGLLYAIIRRLTDRGVAILYVSHRLKEIFDLCDTITVLKDGALVDSRPAGELDESTSCASWSGAHLRLLPRQAVGRTVGEPRLELRGCGNGYVDGVDLDVHAGEIVGLAGLQGSGRTELLEGVFGVRPFTRGEVRPRRHAARRAAPAPPYACAWPSSPRTARPPAWRSTSPSSQRPQRRARGLPAPHLRRPRGHAGLLSGLEVNARSATQEVQYLSGGNQQKVVLARCLGTDPRSSCSTSPPAASTSAPSAASTS